MKLNHLKLKNMMGSLCSIHGGNEKGIKTSVAKHDRRHRHRWNNYIKTSKINVWDYGLNSGQDPFAGIYCNKTSNSIKEDNLLAS